MRGLLDKGERRNLAIRNSANKPISPLILPQNWLVRGTESRARGRPGREAVEVSSLLYVGPRRALVLHRWNERKWQHSDRKSFNQSNSSPLSCQSVNVPTAAGDAFVSYAYQSQYGSRSLLIDFRNAKLMSVRLRSGFQMHSWFVA